MLIPLLTPTDLQHAARWYLRSLGLEPGRAVANSQPTPAQVQARRTDQFNYIVSRCSRSGSTRAGELKGVPGRGVAPPGGQ